MLKTILFFIFLTSIQQSHSKTLFIGDSHAVGIFGKSFDKLIRDSGEQIITHTSCGAVAKWFRTGQKTKCGFYFRDLNGVITSGKVGATPVVDQTIDTFKPDVVVVELGGNYTHRSDSYTVKDIDELVSLIIDSGAKCLWYGAPSARNNARTPRLYRLINEGVKERCLVFNSAAVTKYPEDPRLDGIHYWGKQGRIQAEKWAKQAFEFYLENK